MSSFLHLEIDFGRHVPELASVVEQLGANTGLALGYDKATENLCSDALGTRIGLYPEQVHRYCITVLGEYEPNTRYLVNAAAFALLQLGGTHPYPLAEWASSSWAVAKNLL